MSIRTAKRSDARGIAEVHVAAWQSAYRDLLPDHLLDGLSVKVLEKRWGERIASSWGHLFVCEQAGRIVGFAACGVSRDENIEPGKAGEVHVVYVDPEEWRQGHGSLLLGEALGSLREQGFREALLWVLEGNQRAIAFYEAAGFEADGTSKVKTRADGTEMNVTRYRRPIGEMETRPASRRSSRS